jgi:hypothetical protein
MGLEVYRISTRIPDGIAKDHRHERRFTRKLKEIVMDECLCVDCDFESCLCKECGSFSHCTSRSCGEDIAEPVPGSKTKNKVYGITAAQAWEYIQNHLLSESACSDLEYDGKLALAIVTDIIRDQPDDVGHTLNDFEP